jgi:hypothetical protein
MKAEVRQAWPVALPSWVLLCALIGALVEWEGADEAEDDNNVGPQEPPAAA